MKKLVLTKGQARLVELLRNCSQAHTAPIRRRKLGRSVNGLIKLGVIVCEDWRGNKVVQLGESRELLNGYYKLTDQDVEYTVRESSKSTTRKTKVIRLSDTQVAGIQRGLELNSFHMYDLDGRVGAHWLNWGVRSQKKMQKLGIFVASPHERWQFTVNRDALENTNFVSQVQKVVGEKYLTWNAVAATAARRVGFTVGEVCYKRSDNGAERTFLIVDETPWGYITINCSKTERFVRYSTVLRQLTEKTWTALLVPSYIGDLEAEQDLEMSRTAIVKIMFYDAGLDKLGFEVPL